LKFFISTAVYRLSKEYNLDVSLFERLVRNGVEQVTLTRQRRMRPQISSLIMPIYPKLENHERVTTYPNVLGVSTNVFFLNHAMPETSESEQSSKSNIHEATMIARFCNYLLLQALLIMVVKDLTFSVGIQAQSNYCAFSVFWTSSSPEKGISKTRQCIS
jgi:hypothetical protein